MATTLVEPFAPWLREISRVLAQEGHHGAFVPPADVLVDDEGVTVYMDVPGMRHGELEIELENDVLTVRGERPYPYGKQDGGPSGRIERAFGRFERSLRVPGGLDPDAIEATLADGVLTLRIPKPTTQRPRKIEIRTNGERHAEDAS
jgi:HSP20 family protein